MQLNPSFVAAAIKESSSNEVAIEGNKIDYLDKINLFIGPNNSGKSRLLRTLFSSNHIELIDNNAVELNKKLNELTNLYLVMKEQVGAISSGLEVSELKFNIFSEQFVPENLSIIGSSPGPGDWRSIRTVNPLVFDKMQRQISSLHSEIITSIENFPKLVKEKKILRLYIPILRSLRVLDGSKDLLRDKLEEDYKFANINHVYTGQFFYQDIKEKLLGNKDERMLIEQYEQFLQKYFFERPISLIPRHGSNTIWIEIDGEERPIHFIGDAYQSIIIYTYPLFINKGNSLMVFIEEPELHLHPGMQRKLMAALNSDSLSHCQFFFTSHSNHFLELDFDKSYCSIFSVQKGEGKSISTTLIDHPSFDLMQNLGVRDTSIFRTNCTIWVEGPSDRIYIAHFLNLYNNRHETNWRQDVHFSFVEYSGSNLVHWDFTYDGDEAPSKLVVSRLCGTAFLIVDSDSAEILGKDKKIERQDKLKEVLGDRFYMTPAYEFECLLPENAVRAVLKSWDQENFQEAKLPYSGHNKPFSQWVKYYFKDEFRERYSSKYVRNKVSFAKEAVLKIRSYEDLNEKCERLIEKVVSFIRDSNL